MDTSMSVLGTRATTPDVTMGRGAPADRRTGNRPRGEALETALAVDLEVVKERAQWWNPDLKTKVEAHQPSVVDGADGATENWARGYCRGKRRRMLN